ncbi:hypothetical protein niasHT_029198 [Heterodera trifolii]|uniref:HP domain-containing protein n=1 Tax=Heterodera trifolii TaxID=157864 RepID=A0ABD2JZX6_9BILA
MGGGNEVRDWEKKKDSEEKLIYTKHLEQYLSEAEFVIVFGISREQFGTLPRWRQLIVSMKKEADYSEERKRSNGSVDVSVKIQSENDKGQKNEFFNGRQKGTRTASAFKVSIPKGDPSGGALLRNFYVKIDTRRKGGNVQFNLLDPNGFRIFNKSKRKQRELRTEKQMLKRRKLSGRKPFWQNTSICQNFCDLANGKSQLLRLKTTDKRNWSCPITFRSPSASESTLCPNFTVSFPPVLHMECPLPVNCPFAVRLSNPLTFLRTLSAATNRPHFPFMLLKSLSTEIVSGLWSAKLDLLNCLGTLEFAHEFELLPECWSTARSNRQQHKGTDPFLLAFELVRERHSILLFYNCSASNECVLRLRRSPSYRFTPPPLKGASPTFKWQLQYRRIGGHSGIVTGAVVVAKALGFSLIADQSPQNRVDYFEGEVMEVRVNSANGLTVSGLAPPWDLLWTCDYFSSKLINDGRTMFPFRTQWRNCGTNAFLKTKR